MKGTTSVITTRIQEQLFWQEKKNKKISKLHCHWGLTITGTVISPTYTICGQSGFVDNLY